MPNERWSAAQVIALAPDASSARAGQGASAATKWESAGWGGDLLWGLCRGSGKHPYQVCVDLSEPAYRCSCPSRKFPCKHALGLMLLWSAGGAPEAEAPDWVDEWHAARAAKPRRAPVKKGQPSEAAAGKRADRVAAGMQELDRWLLDQISHGLAGAERSGYGPYEAMAARLVDAQAPGAANAVRRLGRIAGVGAQWADRLLGELALLRLLVAAYGRVGELPDPLAATVRSRVGIPVPTEEVLAGPPLRDRWHVLGQVELADDRLITRRTWLRGTDSGRFALLLAFAPPGQALPADTVPGTAIDADLCWYPGALPMRAVFAHRHAVLQPGTAPAGAPAIREALAGWTAAVAAEPWCESVPMLLAGVTPTDDRHLVDAAGDAVPLSAGHDEPWWLLAASGAARSRSPASTARPGSVRSPPGPRVDTWPPRPVPAATGAVRCSPPSCCPPHWSAPSAAPSPVRRPTVSGSTGAARRRCWRAPRSRWRTGGPAWCPSPGERRSSRPHRRAPSWSRSRRRTASPSCSPTAACRAAARSPWACWATG
ncbi:hypothetical protein Prum_043950 [Phytohabitans rumicis]|uniref:SWIM-type domain-containing protein n=1 Tax=Phytohabitans rumicis TaxID=1076125 RepID=A0A6V8L0A8_9ACTN|nr:SWIM zinc finger family protein [Phytohabitans rumicis]GFJ90753.1 hypothetical protein Prum_043950 [Phytohabitans rumicis]